jgi:hypothetical protein
MKEIIEEAMTKRNKPVEEVKTCKSLMDIVTDVIESDELSDEERLFQLKLLTLLSKLPIEKLKAIRTKLEYCQPLRVIPGGKK